MLWQCHIQYSCCSFSYRTFHPLGTWSDSLNWRFPLAGLLVKSEYIFKKSNFTLTVFHILLFDRCFLFIYIYLILHYDTLISAPITFDDDDDNYWINSLTNWFLSKTIDILYKEGPLAVLWIGESAMLSMTDLVKGKPAFLVKIATF